MKTSLMQVTAKISNTYTRPERFKSARSKSAFFINRAQAFVSLYAGVDIHITCFWEDAHLQPFSNVMWTIYYKPMMYIS